MGHRLKDEPLVLYYARHELNDSGSSVPPKAALDFQGIGLCAAPELVYQFSQGWGGKSLYLVQPGQDRAAGQEPFCKITMTCRWVMANPFFFCQT